jgi:hypothetical protein
MSHERWKENIERSRPVIRPRGAFLLLSIALWILPATAGADPPRPGSTSRPQEFEWVVLLHTHGPLAHGWPAVESLQRTAASRGIDVVVLSEHLVADWEWAPPLLREITGFKRSLPSMQRHGLSAYFEMAAAADRAVPEVVLITGAEVSPYYRWSGYPWVGRLTMWDWQRNLVVLGLSPESLRRLPVAGMRAGRGPGLRDLLWAAVVVCLLIGFLFYLNHLRFGRTLLLGLPLAAMAWMGPAHPRSFSPYAADPGIAPWQAAVDSVEARGGLALWSLVAEVDEQYYRWGRVHTPAHTEVLLQVNNYHGFGVLYPAQPALHEPGNDPPLGMGRGRISLPHAVGHQGNRRGANRRPGALPPARGHSGGIAPWAWLCRARSGPGRLRPTPAGPLRSRPGSRSCLDGGTDGRFGPIRCPGRNRLFGRSVAPDIHAPDPQRPGGSRALGPCPPAAVMVRIRFAEKRTNRASPRGHRPGALAGEQSDSGRSARFPRSFR